MLAHFFLCRNKESEGTDLEGSWEVHFWDLHQNDSSSPENAPILTYFTILEMADMREHFKNKMGEKNERFQKNRKWWILSDFYPTLPDI